MCCQSIWSQEARNAWTTLPGDYKPNSMEPQVYQHLDWLIDELLKLAKQTHPNVKQAACIWLLAVIKGVGECQAITDNMQLIQNTFLDLLCENNGK